MDVTPRKSPRQARAKVTVDAIVEATIQVLLTQGYDRFTTTRAAERAGVSIGSLYQYFPNKAALASAVVDRCCERFLAAFEGALADRQQRSLADCIRAIVDVAFVSHHLAPELHRCVLALGPRIGVGNKAEMASLGAARVIESALRRHAPEISPEVDLATAATIIETSLEALAHRAISDHPVQAPDAALVKEATRLITRYLAIDMPA